MQADARFPPFRPQCADAVLVDAPCTGLGALGRRSDARWHIEKAAIERLAEQQLRILNASCQLLKPGGILTYSVCTFTKKETIGVAEDFASQNTNMKPVALDSQRWRHLGTGGIVLTTRLWDRRNGGISVETGLRFFATGPPVFVSYYSRKLAELPCGQQ